jgi:signal peptidase I
MSASSSYNRDPQGAINDGQPEYPSADTDFSTAGFGRPSRGMGTHRAASPRVVDYRPRGPVIEPTVHFRGPGTPTRKGSRPQRRRRQRLLLVNVVGLLAAAALAIWLLQAFVVQPFSVPGAAMAPAIQAGDRILIVKLGLLEGPIRSGEIVVLRPPKSMACTVAGGGGGGGDLVLRVVAVSGQTIWSVNGTIFVDGRALREPGWYDPRFGQVGSTPIPRTTLAANQYFVMADNRSDACDSRAFGQISKSSIVGKGVAIVARRDHLFFRRL